MNILADMASPNRVAFSPSEFAELFGKSQTWGYRQIYAGKVNAITEHGRVLIPAKEVERLLKGAGIYKGRENSKAAKARVEKLPLEAQSIWQRFMKLRQENGGITPMRTRTKPPVNSELKPKWKTKPRRTTLGKIARSWANPN